MEYATIVMKADGAGAHPTGRSRSSQNEANIDGTGRQHRRIIRERQGIHRTMQERSPPVSGNINEWPDRTVNGMLADEPAGFHFHRVMFNPDTHEMEGLRPVVAESSPS